MTTTPSSRGPSREAYTGVVSSKTTQGQHGRSNDKSVRWYVKDLKDSQLHASTRQLLEEYSNIPSEDVVPHILEIRDRAWDIFPYPCIGMLILILYFNRSSILPIIQPQLSCPAPTSNSKSNSNSHATQAVSASSTFP